MASSGNGQDASCSGFTSGSSMLLSAVVCLSVLLFSAPSFEHIARVVDDSDAAHAIPNTAADGIDFIRPRCELLVSALPAMNESECTNRHANRGSCT